MHDTDKYKYYDKQKRVDLIKYSNGVKKIYDGKAIYLPCRLYNGDDLFNDIVKFVSDNRDTIKNIAGVASFVVDNNGKVCKTTLDIVKKASELQNKQPITDDAVNKVLNATEVKASGFFYV